MALKLKMFDTLGAVTLVTPPSMMNPEKISFTLINLREKEKNHFATELNKVFPEDNVVVYIYDIAGQKGWLNQALSKSKYVVIDQTNLPVWVEEMIPESKKHIITAEHTVEDAFKNISEGIEKNV